MVNIRYYYYLIKKRNLIEDLSDPHRYYRSKLSLNWEGNMKKLCFLFLTAALVASCSSTAQQTSDDPLAILAQRRREYSERQAEETRVKAEQERAKLEAEKKAAEDARKVAEEQRKIEAEKAAAESRAVKTMTLEEQNAYELQILRERIKEMK